MRGGGWEGGLILAGERVQPVGEHLLGLWSEILARICPRWGLGLALGKVYALVATVGGNPMVE